MKFALTIGVVAGGALLALAVIGVGQAPIDQKTVAVSELNKLQVIGWLGQPLGKIVAVEGVVADGDYTRMKADAGRILLRVEVVDGKKLAREHVFHFQTPAITGIQEPKVGGRFKYVGYETGGFTGTPDKTFEYMPAHCTTGYAFTTAFIVLRDEMKPRNVIQSAPAPAGPK